MLVIVDISKTTMPPPPPTLFVIFPYIVHKLLPLVAIIIIVAIFVFCDDVTLSGEGGGRFVLHCVYVMSTNQKIYKKKLCATEEEAKKRLHLWQTLLQVEEVMAMMVSEVMAKEE